MASVEREAISARRSMASCCSADADPDFGASVAPVPAASDSDAFAGMACAFGCARWSAAGRVAARLREVGFVMPASGGDARCAAGSARLDVLRALRVWGVVLMSGLRLRAPPSDSADHEGQRLRE